MLCPICHTANEENAALCHECFVPLEGSTPGSTSASALPPGTKLQEGAFVLGSMLGQGGFGITYLGSDTRLRRLVAIKEFFPAHCAREGNAVCPSGSLSEDDFAGAKVRFLDEARVLAQFRHPGIVDVYTFFEENNTAYMVMGYLQGRTLAAHVQERGALPEKEAVGYIEQIAAALQQVHGSGLLHRDIKPENVLICASSGQERLVLIDFGLTKDVASGGTYKTQPLSGTTHFGTPGYAPLEQYSRHTQLSTAADIYALGATLYHLLTGEEPLPATDRAAGLEMSPPRGRNGALSDAVREAVETAMQLRADARPQTVSDFLELLKDREETGPTAPVMSSPAVPGPAANTAVSEQFLVHTLIGHRDKVSAVALSPDGRTVASGSHDHTVRLWNTNSGELRKTLLGHGERVSSVVFSPDGETVISGSFDGTIRLWDAYTGEPRKTLYWTFLQMMIGHEHWVSSVACSPTLIANASSQYYRSGAATIWDATSGKLLKTLRGHRGWVSAVAFSPDGTLLASCGYDGPVKLWTAASGVLQSTLADNLSAVNALAFSPDGEFLAVGSGQAPVELWEPERGVLRRHLAERSSGVASLAFSPDGKLIATANARYDEALRLWDVMSGKLWLTLHGHRDGANAVAFARDPSGSGHLLASGSADRTVKVWRVE